MDAPDRVRHPDWGSPIKGSWMLRVYCCVCDQPMRIERSQLTGGMYGEFLKYQICMDCRDREPHRVHYDLDYSKLQKVCEELSGWQENAIRELEADR